MIPRPPSCPSPIVVMCDLEYGGLRPGKHAILSSDWRSTDGTFHLSALHRPAPGREVTQSSLDMNKLDLNECKEGMLFGDFFLTFIAPLCRRYPKVYLVAHNCFSSDAMFIMDAIRDAPRSALLSISNIHFCDTMLPVTTVTMTSGKLKDAYEKLCGKTHPPITDWHKADVDTRALLAVYTHLVARGLEIPERPITSFFRHATK